MCRLGRLKRKARQIDGSSRGRKKLAKTQGDEARFSASALGCLALLLLLLS